MNVDNRDPDPSSWTDRIPPIAIVAVCALGLAVLSVVRGVTLSGSLNIALISSAVGLLFIIVLMGIAHLVHRSRQKGSAADQDHGGCHGVTDSVDDS